MENAWNNFSEENLLESRKPILIQVNGHPERTLALRLGLKAKNKKVEVKLIQPLGKKLFRINFVDYAIFGKVVLMHDPKNKIYYAKTFYNLRSNWFLTVKKATGFDESYIKNNMELSLEQLVDCHQKIAGY